MQLPSIAIVNFSKLKEQEVQDAVRAVNRQVLEDFLPIWGCGRLCKVHATKFELADEETTGKDPVNADSVIYLVDEGTVKTALGYHSINASELPIGFVYVNAGDWTITLSHEVLELIVDPSVNIFVIGPHPFEPERQLLHAYEVCDAVERFSYEIDGIEVSDFVTPHYFVEGDAPGTRNDFLGVGVPSFGVMPGCHLGVIDWNSGEWQEIYGKKKLASLVSKKSIVQFARGETAQNKKPPKPKRPTDAKLCKILHEFNEECPHGCNEIGWLTGITRTSRYKSRAGG